MTDKNDPMVLEQLFTEGKIEAALLLADKLKDKEAAVEVLNDNAVAIQQGFNMADDAVKILEKAIELDPKNPQLHINLGVAYSEPQLITHDKENIQRAIKAYRKAIKLDPDSALAHYNLGLLLAFTHKTGEAKKMYERAVQLEPENKGNFSGLLRVIEIRNME